MRYEVNLKLKSRLFQRWKKQDRYKTETSSEFVDGFCYFYSVQYQNPLNNYSQIIYFIVLTCFLIFVTEILVWIVKYSDFFVKFLRLIYLVFITMFNFKQSLPYLFFKVTKFVEYKNNSKVIFKTLIILS